MLENSVDSYCFCYWITVYRLVFFVIDNFVTAMVSDLYLLLTSEKTVINVSLIWKHDP